MGQAKPRSPRHEVRERFAGRGRVNTLHSLRKPLWIANRTEGYRITAIRAPAAETSESPGPAGRIRYGLRTE
jgi:hypothetical protein